MAFIDDIVQEVFRLKKNGHDEVLLWGRDLSDCFRQIPLCPSSYPNNGLLDPSGEYSIENDTIADLHVAT
jgi:hypothetical protein